MLTLNVIRDENDQVITGVVNGEKFSVPFSDEVYKNLLIQKEALNAVETSEEYDKWVDSVKVSLSTQTLDVITTACKDLVRDETGYYRVKVEEADGTVTTSKKAVPSQLVSVILESAEKGIDPTPIVKAWIRFLRNPNFTPSKAELFARYITATIVDWEEKERLIQEEGFVDAKAELRATYNDVAITQEGLIVGKKYAELLNEGWEIDKETNKAVKTPLHGKTQDSIDPVTGKITKGEFIQPEFNEELTFIPPVMGTRGDEFFCDSNKGHVIKVGAKHTLEDWSYVNCNDDRSCVKGLHIGGWQYVQCYKNLKAQLLECFVDPAEIGAICDIYRGDGAMRVREYFIFGATEGRNKGIYHSSKYAAMKDAEWEAYKKEAVAKSNKLIAKLNQDVEDLGL